MSALKLNAISFSRPKQLHDAQRLQRCRSTATKNSAGNRSVLITRPLHVVASSLRREEATIAAGGEDGSSLLHRAGSLLAAVLNKAALPVMLCATLATSLGPEAALAAASSGGRMGGSNFNRSKTPSARAAPQRDYAPPPRETVRETVRTETNVVVIQQAPPPSFFPIVPFVPIPIIPFGGGFGGGGDSRNTREMENNRELDLRQAEDIATLKAKNDFEQQQIQELKNELNSLKVR